MKFAAVEENSLAVDKDRAVVPCLAEVSNGPVVDLYRSEHTTMS